MLNIAGRFKLGWFLLLSSWLLRERAEFPELASSWIDIWSICNKQVAPNLQRYLLSKPTDIQAIWIIMLLAYFGCLYQSVLKWLVLEHVLLFLMWLSKYFYEFVLQNRALQEDLVNSQLITSPNGMTKTHLYFIKN